VKEAFEDEERKNERSIAQLLTSLNQGRKAGIDINVKVGYED
jgi:hypothetical protein